MPGLISEQLAQVDRVIAANKTDSSTLQRIKISGPLRESHWLNVSDHTMAKIRDILAETVMD